MSTQVMSNDRSLKISIILSILDLNNQRYAIEKEKLNSEINNAQQKISNINMFYDGDKKLKVLWANFSNGHILKSLTELGYLLTLSFFMSMAVFFNYILFNLSVDDPKILIFNIPFIAGGILVIVGFWGFFKDKEKIVEIENLDLLRLNLRRLKTLKFNLDKLFLDQLRNNSNKIEVSSENDDSLKLYLTDFLNSEISNDVRDNLSQNFSSKELEEFNHKQKINYGDVIKLIS